MITAELVSPGNIELRDVPEPEPGVGEVLVRIDAALTCGTEVKLFERGHARLQLPLRLGHEASGTIVACGGGVTDFKDGDPVAWLPTAPCGVCRLCMRGNDSLCASAVGRMLFGAFAEYLVIPRHIVAQHLFHRPYGMSAVEAAGVEPLACVMHGMRRLSFRPGDRVLVIGDGAIALLFAQVLKAKPDLHVVLAGRHQMRLGAASRFGCTVIDTNTAPLRDAIMQEFDGEGADMVVECVGRPETWEAAASLAATGGTALMFGGCASGSRVTFDAEAIHYREVDVIGAFHYGRQDAQQAWWLLEGGVIQIEPLVTHTRSITQIHQAIDLMRSREAVKVRITI